AAGAADDLGDGLDPVAGLELIDVRVAHGGQQVHLGRLEVAVLVGFLDLTGQEDGDVLLGVFTFEPVPGVAEGVGVGVGDGSDDEGDTIHGFGLIEEGFGVEGGTGTAGGGVGATGGGFGALGLLEFFVAVLGLGDGGPGAAVG